MKNKKTTCAARVNTLNYNIPYLKTGFNSDDKE